VADAEDVIVRLLKLSISIIVYISDRVADGLRKCLSSGNTRRHVILYYHSIPDEKRDKFSHQMDMVKRHAEPIMLTGNINTSKSAVSITFDDGIENVYRNAVPELVARGIPFTIFVTSGYVGRQADWIKNRAEYREERLMSVEQLLEISKMELAEIGSHSVSHKDLTTIDENDARREIAESKNMLEKMLNVEILAFSYPYGKYSRTHVTYAKEAGYMRTYSIEPRVASLEGYVNGRFSVGLDDWDMEFILKMKSSYRWLIAVAKWKSLISKY